MIDIDAFHLPGLELGGHRDWDTLEYDGVRLRVPILTPDAVRRLADGLRQARDRELARRPVADIVAAIDHAAASLTEGALRRQVDDALPAVARYSPPMARLVMERMSADWRAPALDGLLKAELGDPAVLDRFVADAAGRRVHATGPALAFHVFAGNVPGVAITAAVRSLLVRAATLAKTASDEPLLPALFARALAAADPGLGRCIAVTYWPGGRDDLNAAAAGAADAVVVYGGEEAVRTLRGMTAPDQRFVAHGPRVSFGLVGREADHTTAARVARATAVFDQHGCVSPHVVYVEDEGRVSPEGFAEEVAQRLEAIEAELPRGPGTPAEAAAIHQVRGGAEFRELAGAGVKLFAAARTRSTVIFDPDPAFALSCLNRTLWIKRVGDLQEVAGHVEPFRRFLQSAAIAGAGARTQDLGIQLARVGVARITDFDRLPWPPASWHHDGRGPLRELLRWTDLEGQAG